jgi:nicotinate-nucleotide pyrophosphorylase (carboxylating)
MHYGRPEDLETLIQLALREDIGNGDITTAAIFSGDEHCHGSLIAKEDGIIAGIALSKSIFPRLSDEIRIKPLVKDGDKVRKGMTIAQLSGPADALLTAERTVLNFMQRMSGIATLTRAFADKIAHTNAKILDTRKTVPGHRITDKWAVLIGGGENHRIRLDDRYLIKENHISVAGSLAKAISECDKHRIKLGTTTPIEIEVERLDQFLEVHINHVKTVKYVLLDNMSLSDMEKVKELNKGVFLLEASGNVTLETVKEIAETGVDYISSGSLTHSVKALDISMLLDL